MKLYHTGFLGPFEDACFKAAYTYKPRLQNLLVHQYRIIQIGMEFLTNPKNHCDLSACDNLDISVL